MRKPIMACIACFLAVSAYAQSASITVSENNVKTSGLVYVEYFYEEPNYGEAPPSDHISGACLMKLDKPINFNNEPIHKVHLIAETGAFPCDKYIGHQVEVKGNVEEITTGHQHGDALFFVHDAAILR